MILRIYFKKDYTDTPDPSYSVKLWKKAAQKGDSHAQYLLGLSYHNGIGGLIKDKKECFKWLKKSADQGFFPEETVLLFPCF